LPLAAASTGVKGLKAIVPIAGVSSYYDHRRSYGTVINSNPTIGTDADTLFDNILTRRQPQACAYMRERIAIQKDRTTGDYNQWWDERNYTNYVDNFRAAVFISHGLNDLNTKPRMYARLYAALKKHRVPAKIWLNQGGHGDGANSGARQAAWRDALNRFWSNQLFGVDNDAMKGPKAAVQREDGVWVDYADWPAPGATPTRLYLRAGAGDTHGGIGKNWLFPGFSLEREKIVDNSAIDATVLVAAPESPHRLVYQSDPLQAPVHISGIPQVSLFMASHQPAAIVSAMVVDYRADGTARIVTRGWADPQNRWSIYRTMRIFEGLYFPLDFELQPHDYVFQPGSRIGVVVMSSDRLFTLRPPPGTELDLIPALSTVELPIVGGKRAFAEASH
jgi:X-Pro dipeptidyl-peptidase